MSEAVDFLFWKGQFPSASCLPPSNPLCLCLFSLSFLA